MYVSFFRAEVRFYVLFSLKMTLFESNMSTCMHLRNTDVILKEVNLIP
jgi:hypothetical protein